MTEKAEKPLRKNDTVIQGNDDQLSSRENKTNQNMATGIGAGSRATNADGRGHNSGMNYQVAATLLALIAATASSFSAIYTRQQASIAESALFSDQRAWIGPPQVKASIKGNDVEFTYTFKNFGRSPNHGLHIDGRIISINTAADWEKAVADYCEDGKKVAGEKTHHWDVWAIVPQSDFILPAPDTMSRGSKPNLLDKYLVGCVTYGQASGNGMNTTGFYGPVQYRDGKIEIPTVYAIAPD